MLHSKDSKLLQDLSRSENHFGRTLSTTSLPSKERDKARASTNDRPALSVSRVPTSAQKVCFVALCVYLLSGFANEFAFRFIHSKAYISTIMLVMLPFVFVATGSALRGMRTALGRWLLAFGIWLAICAPFSVWKSDTLNVLLNYYFRSFFLYFVICACVTSLRQLKTLMYVFAWGNIFVLLSCLAFGTAQNGRFAVPGSVFSFLSNSNELGLQLLLGMIFLLFGLLRGRHLVTKTGAAAGIALSAVYMLKTGSRGTFLAASVMMLVYFLLTRKKVKLLTIMLPFAVISLLLIPEDARHRLTYIAFANKEIAVSNGEDASALGSQMQRQQLFWDSVSITVHHPIFGVGPGEFPVADAHLAEDKGESAMWRQTHNSYTQVSSEAGIPALIFYLCCLVICLRLNYRMYKGTARRPELKDYSALSLCMLLCIVAYVVDTIFDQLAYSHYLPVLGGITMAAYFIAQPTLQPRSVE